MSNSYPLITEGTYNILKRTEYPLTFISEVPVNMPSVHTIVDWIRTTYNIDIVVFPYNLEGKVYKYVIVYAHNRDKLYQLMDEQIVYFPSYEKALEMAAREVLSLFTEEIT